MKLDNKYIGLNDNDVIASRKKYGSNSLEKKKKVNLFIKIFKIMLEPMFLLLIITSLIYFILGEISDGIIMIISVISMIAIDSFQEFKTDKAIETLNILSSINVKVIRNSREITIDSEDIVVDDLVILEEGDKISADGLIIEASGLGVDESALTGESTIVHKKIKDDSEDHFRKNVCYAGTNVTNGSAIIKIINVGNNTEYGKIGTALNSIVKEKTPLEKQIKNLVIICSIFSFMFCLLVSLINLIHTGNLITSLLSGLTVAMATIPEEIPVVLTVYLALGAFNLAKQNTLTRSMKAVETLGAVSVLCVDKTGTLTQNKMKVQDCYKLSDNILKSSFLACPLNPFDPMEISIQKYCIDKGIKKDMYNDYHLVHEYIFNNEMKMMGQIWEQDNKKTLYVKGSCENVLSLCNLDKDNLNKVTAKMKEYSDKGYRVLAVGMKEIEDIPHKLTQNKIDLCGIIALEDPPRSGVEDSIKECYKAGIRTIMITGDNGDTAKGIAAQINLKHNNSVITGLELEKMSDEELEEKVKTTNIFARVYPNHKMRIVSALQKNGEVVAMTGDGVNDAPALKKAEIGIAMGQRGTNVAKEAADIILMDDNFNTIVKAIQNGRQIYKNIQKAISYILIIHIPIALTALAVPLFNYPVLLLPIHIVIMELIIDPTSSIIFQRIKSEKDIMKEKPRRMDAKLISKKELIKCITQGLSLFIVFFGSYIFLLNNNYSKEFASTFSLTVLILSNILLVNVLQSNKLAINNLIDNLKDDIIVIIMGIILIALLLIIYIPALNNIVGTTPLSFNYLVMALLLSIVSTVYIDLLKIKRD